MLHRDWLRRNDRRHELMVGWEEWFETHDLLLCPAAWSPAVPHDQAGERHDRTIALATFLDELLAFPRGRHDDQVDSVSQFLKWAWGRSRRPNLHGPKLVTTEGVSSGGPFEDSW